MSDVAAVPRRRKSDFWKPADGSESGLDVLYERVARIEETINLQFDSLDGRLHILNQLRQEVVTDRNLFVNRDSFDTFKEHIDRRLRATDRTVWTAMGAAAAFGAVAQFMIWILTHVHW